MEEKGDVLVNEIADNIQKMLNDKVEAVRVSQRGSYFTHISLSYFIWDRGKQNSPRWDAVCLHVPFIEK